MLNKVCFTILAYLSLYSSPVLVYILLTKGCVAIVAHQSLYYYYRLSKSCVNPVAYKSLCNYCSLKYVCIKVTTYQSLCKSSLLLILNSSKCHGLPKLDRRYVNKQTITLYMYVRVYGRDVMFHIYCFVLTFGH